LRAGCSAAFGIDGEGTQAVVIVCEFDGNKADADFEELVNLIRGAVGEEYDLGVDGICVLAKGMVPKTTSGKVQRSLARSLYLAGKLDPLHTWVARRDLHEKVQSCQARESKGRH
jgi:acyl-CoA synthetase (AMP-forming)/AMP-acid ligase II